MTICSMSFDSLGHYFIHLSSAFDTVHHITLIDRLRISYGIQGRALSWFSSFLSNRHQSIHCSASYLPPAAISHGVPQGSVLGPILFLLYTADLHHLIRNHSLHLHAYADDILLYGFSPPSDCEDLKQRIATCILDVRSWLQSNRLKLNA